GSTPTRASEQGGGCNDRRTSSDGVFAARVLRDHVVSGDRARAMGATHAQLDGRDAGLLRRMFSAGRAGDHLLRQVTDRRNAGGRRAAAAAPALAAHGVVRRGSLEAARGDQRRIGADRPHPRTSSVKESNMPRLTKFEEYRDRYPDFALEKTD